MSTKSKSCRQVAALDSLAAAAFMIRDAGGRMLTTGNIDHQAPPVTPHDKSVQVTGGRAILPAAAF